MYSNTKDAKVTILQVATIPAVLETINVSKSNRMFDEFSFQVAGFASVAISSTAVNTLNGGFETAGATPPAGLNWAETLQGGAAIAQVTENRVGSLGTNSLQMTVGANGVLVAAIQQTVLVPGHSYTFSIWVKGAAGGEKLQVFSQSTMILEILCTTSFVLHSITFTAGANDTTLILMSKSHISNNNAVITLDDVTLIDNTGFMRAPTDLDAFLEASLDGVNWTSIQAVTEADHGVIKYVSGKLVQMFRARVSAITTADEVTDNVQVNCIAS